MVFIIAFICFLFIKRTVIHTSSQQICRQVNTGRYAKTFRNTEIDKSIRSQKQIKNRNTRYDIIFEFYIISIKILVVVIEIFHINTGKTMKRKCYFIYNKGVSPSELSI